jgi:hypothetical protein
VPSVRGAVALFGVVSGVLAISWLWYYRSLVDYCEPENDRLGRSGLDCLQPSHWFAISGMLFASLLVEIALAVVVGAALVRSRKHQPAKRSD